MNKDRVALDFVTDTAADLADCIRKGIKELAWENKKITAKAKKQSFS